MSNPANTPSTTEAADAIAAAADATPNGEPALTPTEGAEPKLNLQNIFSDLDKPPADIALVKDDDDAAADEPAERPEPDLAKDAPTPRETAPAKGRDLSKFDERDRPYLKQMSKQAFEHFSKRLDGLSTTISQRDDLVKTLQTQLAESADKKLPDSWYEDPEAGRVSPEYRDTEKKFLATQQETHQISEMLVRYRSGAVKYDAKAKDFVPNDDETPIDPGVEQWLSDNRQLLFEKQKELAAKGNAVLESFGKTYKSDVDFTKAWVEKQFPWLKDEKSPNQEVYKACLEQIKPSLRKSPLASVVGTLGVAALMWAQRAQTAEKENAALKASKGDRRLAGPTPNGRSSRPVVDQDEDKKFTKADDIFN